MQHAEENENQAEQECQPTAPVKRCPNDFNLSFIARNAPDASSPHSDPRIQQSRNDAGNSNNTPGV